MFLLSNLVAPRVGSAVFSTIWNRWTTHRRFQRRSEASNRCLLGCAPGAEDSVEHYAVCPCTRELASRYLRLDPVLQVNLYTFTCCNPHIQSTEDLVTSGLLVYAVYRATNHIRRTPLPPNACIYDALAQWAREGARGHSRSSRILDSRWHQDRPRTPLPSIPIRFPPSIEIGARKRRRTALAPTPGPASRSATPRA